MGITRTYLAITELAKLLGFVSKLQVPFTLTQINATVTSVITYATNFILLQIHWRFHC